MNPPCSAIAVHRRRHAELADAVAHVAAGEVVRRQRLQALGDRQVRMGEVGRSAERRGDRGVDRPRAPSRTPCARRRSAPWRRGRPCRRPCARRSPPGSRPATAASKRARSGSAGELRLPGEALVARARARPRATPPECRPGSRTAGTASRAFARAASISAAPSGAPCVASVPCLFGAPKPITVRQAIRVGRSLRPALRRAPPRSPPDRGRRPRACASPPPRSARAGR